MAELMSTLRVNENDYTIKDAVAWSRIDDLYAIKESLANKVTSIDQDSTDTEYPSAKCVYDAIQANSGLFVEITYGTTTSAAIDDILAAGKYPYLYNGSRLYIYASSTTYYHMFTAFTEVGSVIWYGINVLRSSSAYSQVIISQSNAVDSSSTNSQIPSAKAVYDFVANAVKLYRHNILIEFDPGLGLSFYKNYITIISKNNTQMDAAALAAYLYNQCSGIRQPAAGNFPDGGMNAAQTMNISSSAGTNIEFYGYNSAGYQTNTMPYSNFVITDTIVEVS